MLQFLRRRLLASLLTLFGITTITFALARVVPSDPAVLYTGPHARPEAIARVTKQLGLDRPLYEQYWGYLVDLVHGDWGRSLATKEPVLSGIATKLPATLELIFLAMTLAVVIGVPLGVYAAYRKGGLPDAGARVGSVVGLSMPVFWLGLLLQFVFAEWLQLLPANGRLSLEMSVLDPITKITGFYLFDSLVTGNWAGFRDAGSHLILPTITLAAYPAALITRMTRAAMLDVLSQDYVRTARTFGLSERLVLWRLALRNAMPTTLTVSGLSLAYLVTGSFFVELIFNWPGIGQYSTTAMLNVDYPAIMGITLLGATVFLLINLAVDLLQAKLDPRIRLQ